MSEQFSGTIAVDERQRFDETALRQWFASHVDPSAGKRMDVSQFKGGQSNPTFLVETPEARYVVRRKPAGVLLPSAHAVEREFRVMKALGGTDVPVPEVHALCEDASVIGSTFYVMAFMDGRVLWDPTLPDATPAERGAICDEMNRVLAALHSVDPDAVGLGDYGKPGNYLQRQVDRWSRQYRASETERIEPMEEVMAWLPGNLPPQQGTSIVHGDYRLDNLVFAHDAPRIIAILDWELSTLGDPLADFAYHCMAWHLSPPFRGLGHLSATEKAELNLPSERAYVDAYSRRRAVPEVPPEQWRAYMAFNLFRAAAIAQGIMGRALAGNASSAHALDAGRQARTLAELGWAQVEPR
ncbi:MAG: phosphotransferase family protein [Comamonadaceae bacterium]|nr:MAG: phosphotransferase family protein [Comamonadaceae bacterium]